MILPGIWGERSTYTVLDTYVKMDEPEHYDLFGG